MTKYLISKDARNDLKEIAEYTLHHWGRGIFNEYRSGLKEKFVAIANDEVTKKPFSRRMSDVFVTKYRYHFIFYIYKTNTLMIIAVIHEQRDIIRHLRQRLE